jgi:hypothetical protein
MGDRGRFIGDSLEKLIDSGEIFFFIQNAKQIYVRSMMPFPPWICTSLDFHPIVVSLFIEVL